jgi:hypothetical protein
MSRIRATYLSIRSGSRSALRSVGLAVLALIALPGLPDARERKFDLTPFTNSTGDWRTRELFTGALITFYGQFTPAALSYDDGVERRTYAPVGNSNKTGRVGLRWHIRKIRDWSPVFRAELGINIRASKTVNQDTPNGLDWSKDESNLRKLELMLKHPRLGIVTVGQGSMATDGITEIDYSGTSVVAYSDVSPSSSAQFLRLADGTLSSAQLGGFIDNYEGANFIGTFSDGNRKMRLRYDTPNFRGFVFSAAVGNDVLQDDLGNNADMAVTYEGKLGDYKLAAGVGYNWQDAKQVLSGSVSPLHDPTGLNVTVALGGEESGGEFSYLKLGLLRSYWEFGQTAISLDYYQGNNINSDGSRARSIGLAFVQSFDRFDLQGYALLRRYMFDEPDVSYLDSTVAMAGIRWAF